MQDAGWLTCAVGCGDRVGEGLSKLITEGLGGNPELDTEDGPGVAVALEWLLFEEMLVESEKIKISNASVLISNKFVIKIFISCNIYSS